MYSVNQITADASQIQNLYLPDGTYFTMELFYSPLQYGWFMNLTYGDFALNGFRVVTSPNILRQFKNIITFGLCVTMKDNLEPTNQQDFSSGNAKMYILNSDEVAQYEAYLNG